MPRAQFRDTVLVPNASGYLQIAPSGTLVALYNVGTTTPISDPISSSSGGALANPVPVDADGHIEFWLPDERELDIVVSAPGFADARSTITADAATGTSVGDARYLQLTGGTMTGAITGFVDKGGQVFNVKAYGAVGDGLTDDSSAIQSAINAVPNGAGLLLFPPGTYLINTGLTLPTGFSGTCPRYLIEGYGATLKTTASIVMLGGLPPDQTTASNWVSRRFTVRGLSFLGNRTSGQVGLQIGASYGSVIEECMFFSLDTGLDLQFCLMTSVRSCFGQNNVTDSFKARYGTWSGASTANSASNHTVFSQCRDYAGAAQTREFYVLGSNGCRLEDCITEGSNPVDAVVFDAASSTTVKYFVVRNHHGENTPSHDVVWTPPYGGLVEINGLFQQSAPGNAVIDATGSSGGGYMHISNIPYWVGGGKLCTITNDGLRWQFDNLYGILDPLNSANWVSGNLGQFVWSYDNNSGFARLNGKGAVYLQSTGSVTLTAGNQMVFSDKLAITTPNGVTINPVIMSPNSTYFYRDEATKKVNMLTVDSASAQTTVAIGNYVGAGFGRLVKSVAGSADVTLTATEYANSILEFTGAIGANINVIVPLTAGLEFTIFNNTSGAFTLTVKGTTGTGIAVGQGKRAMLYTDGTNVQRATADV